MKRLALLFIGIMLFPFFSNAGGIVTNTNQSAAWVRMFARDASTGIDAVYFNPAGLAKLGDGLYLSLTDQIITQNRYISSDYEYLNTSDFEGSVFAPIFPSVYAAYKKGKFAVSFGFNVIGGGGSATFEKGLPMFDMSASDLVPMLNSPYDATSYSLDAYLEGSSVYYGYQLGVTYAINDMIAVYLGARYVSATNTYVGHLNDITLNPGEPSELLASTYFTNAAAQLQPLDAGLGGLVTGGASTLTLAQAEGIGAITNAQRLALEGGLTALGIPTATPIGTAYGIVHPNYTKAAAASVLLQDQEGDIEQKGSGWAPIIGVNLSLMESKLNIGMKYEFETNMVLENNVADGKGFAIGMDATGNKVYMYNDGEEVNSDMPAMFSIGADYKVTDKFSVAIGGHHYWDKQANYGKKIDGVYVDNDEVINKGLWEFALGMEYKVSEKLLFSLGYLHTQIGVKEIYQSNLSYTNSSNSIGFGGAYKVTPAIELNLGFGYTTYESFDKNFDHDLGGSGTLVPVVESYDKDNMFIAIGLDFKLFGNK
jgi:long-chain fatty acid transport protein